MKFNYLAVSEIGQSRNKNEDAYGVYVVDDGLLVIVCDGLGGNKAGDIASQYSVKKIFNSFSNSSDEDYLVRIKNSIKNAHSGLIEEGENNYNFSGMATTAEVLYINDNYAYWGHVGDSRIYHLSKNKLKQLTKDHSLVQKLVDEGYLSLKEAENHPNKNIIMRALGDSDELEIDLSKVKITNSGSDDLFFVCTDGVSGVIDNNELENILILKDLHNISANLKNIIEERGAPDNYTFVIVSKNIKS